jgi:uncharacterized protein with ATP-grasp and redox domains
MQTYLDCYPCILRQSIEAARMAGASQSQQRSIVLRTLEILRETPEGVTPPEIGTKVHRAVREMTGTADPYRRVKREATLKALGMLPDLRERLAQANDRLDTALRLSIAGNIIDFGPNPQYDLWEVVASVLEQDLAIDHTGDLKKRLQSVDAILYLSDNAGETVFDRLFIEALPKPVTYVVRQGPVINDATMEDALLAGIDQVAEVFENGSQDPGTILSHCSAAFRAKFEAAPLILAKGMANYETLSGVSAPLFFLLQVKCPVISQDIGVPVGSAVVKHAGGRL